jgi:hypothetical protein
MPPERKLLMSKRTRLIVAACCLALVLGLPVAAQTAHRGPADAGSRPSISSLWNHLSTTFAELLQRLTGTFAKDGTGLTPPPSTSNGGNLPAGPCDDRGGIDPWGCP